MSRCVTSSARRCCSTSLHVRVGTKTAMLHGLKPHTSRARDSMTHSAAVQWLGTPRRSKSAVGITGVAPRDGSSPSALGAAAASSARGGLSASRAIIESAIRSSSFCGSSTVRLTASFCAVKAKTIRKARQSPCCRAALAVAIARTVRKQWSPHGSIAGSSRLGDISRSADLIVAMRPAPVPTVKTRSAAVAISRLPRAFVQSTPRAPNHAAGNRS